MDRYIFHFKKDNSFPAIFIFSLRSGGDMRIRKNLDYFIKKIKPSPKRIVSGQQIHDSRIGLVKKESPSLFFGCDALITKEKRVALTVFTADCLPIFLYDFKNQVLGLIHAGWRSTKNKIVAETLKLMQSSFASRPANLYVAFGPAIRDCCYKVGREFRNFFPQRYIIKRKNRLYFDLVGINQDELINYGVKRAHFLDCLLCTSCNNDILFSYRKEGSQSGRIVSLGMLI
ncbi:MAG: peptidoglycan editing factor PgeF [Candidatus Omnitrophica bacterium]|nr:peptidoglycan editing factor PgeF [Candidatus Omnitrophota bacterium]